MYFFFSFIVLTSNRLTPISTTETFHFLEIFVSIGFLSIFTTHSPSVTPYLMSLSSESAVSPWTLGINTSLSFSLLLLLHYICSVMSNSVPLLDGSPPGSPASTNFCASGFTQTHNPSASWTNQTTQQSQLLIFSAMCFSLLFIFSLNRFGSSLLWHSHKNILLCSCLDNNKQITAGQNCLRMTGFTAQNSGSQTPNGNSSLLIVHEFAAIPRHPMSHFFQI